MANPIPLPTVPITDNILTSFLGGYKAPQNKISEMSRHGELLRLKRGLYLPFSEDLDIQHRFLAANHICSPSYVSRESALRFYGLIPEHVFATTSVTTKRSQKFDTPLGFFYYDYLPLEYYRLGIDFKIENGVSFLIATPEKALADYIVLTSKLRLRYLKETLEFLEEDLRLDMDLFSEMRPEFFEEFAQVCRKPQTMLNIAKLLRL